jgi:hypothetical protein
MFPEDDGIVTPCPAQTISSVTRMDAGSRCDNIAHAGRGSVVTWMQIMGEVRRLDDRRKRAEHLGEDDAAGLVTMLLDFHNQAVVSVPAPSRPALRRTSQGQEKGR